MRLTSILVVAAMICTPAFGAYTVTQGSSAPTYATTLNFDEPGGPVGAGLPTNSWSVSHGITELMSGDGTQIVDDFSGANPWINDGNAFTGTWGVFIKWADDLTEFSTQVWDPSGPPSPFGGGMGVFVFNNDVEVASTFVEPAWGGIGLDWMDITTTGGMVFDEVRILGFGFFPTTFVDNLSWNVVPEPSSLLLLTSAVGLVISRRRR